MEPRERLIVALDVSTAAAARKIVAAVGDSACRYKVGMQLYTAEGPPIVRELVASGRRFFSTSSTTTSPIRWHARCERQRSWA